MLRGIDPLLTPDLLHSLAAMGHGDRVAIVDANFPSHARGRRVHHLPGLGAAPVLRAVLTVLPLDSFVPNPAATMRPVDRPDEVPPAVADLIAALAAEGHAVPETVERFDFYEMVQGAFAVVQTGELRPYGNVVLTKGVLFGG
ncbi:RbsD/FucU family protein [Rhizosaccharibacter radicis]|uniref:Ribose ABC transporter n=1 Tax=Rhizosaccharibacter radicis TaxID=2782605 RepID=A0ABT1VYL9_9PROT|nr:ribose ABC transporter [Acetobacteraceae bacterium KSS12]